jgi:hypothetical protein
VKKGFWEFNKMQWFANFTFAFTYSFCFVTFGWGANLMGKFNNIAKITFKISPYTSWQPYILAVFLQSTLHPHTHEQHYGRVRDDAPLQFYFALLASC